MTSTNPIDTLTGQWWDAIREMLRERRETLGLSQRALSEMMQTSAQYVGILERGEKYPTVLTLMRWVTALGAIQAGITFSTHPPARADSPPGPDR